MRLKFLIVLEETVQIVAVFFGNLMSRFADFSDNRIVHSENSRFNNSRGVSRAGTGRFNSEFNCFKWPAFW